MAYLTRSGPRDQTIVNFASLGILVPLLDKVNIANIIDRHIPADPQAEYSHGTVLNVLLAARLNHPTALVNVADWAAEHGVEYLCNIPADKLNDDRIGRSLDAFFEHRHAILAEVTCAVLRLTKLDLQRCHFDPTHLILYGTYEDSEPRPQGPLDLSSSRRHTTFPLVSWARRCVYATASASRPRSPGGAARGLRGTPALSPRSLR